MSTVFEDLIKVVKAHPVIYDISAEGYQKRGSKRVKAWLAIARCMQKRGHNISIDGCRKRWNKLKFSYTRDRTLKKVQNTPPRKSPCAKYFDSLEFLDPFLVDYKARPRDVQPIVLDSESEKEGDTDSRSFLFDLKGRRSELSQSDEESEECTARKDCASSRKSKRKPTTL